MKKILIALLALSTFSAFAECIKYNAFSGNEGIYSWCTGDKVYASPRGPTKYLKGVISKVSMVPTSDWFNTISSIKITVLLDSKQTIEVGSHSTFKTKGCQIYGTHNSWDSREFCNGEKVDMPHYYQGTNRPTGESTSGKIIAVGFVQALVETSGGVLSERGSFKE